MQCKGFYVFHHLTASVCKEHYNIFTNKNLPEKNIWLYIPIAQKTAGIQLWFEKKDTEIVVAAHILMDAI